MYKGYITFKNKASNSSDLKLIMTAPPLITHSEIRHDTFTIPGRDGDLFSKDTYRGNASVKVSFDLATTGAVGNYTTAMNKVYQWLQGTGNLIISDEPGMFYEVKKVMITTDQRDIVSYGHIEAEFIVYPYKFLDQTNQSTIALSITNNYDECWPLYVYNSLYAGQERIFSVNGNTMKVTMEESFSRAYIDTRRQIAYHMDGNTKIEIQVAGDYRKLALLPGNNSITIATSGDSIETTPRWGYKI